MSSTCKTIRELPYERYLDKVLGGWIGKSLGGIVGAPFEAHKILGNMTARNCWPEKLYPNDDLDIQIVWLEMLEERGPKFTRQDLVDLWQDRCWYNFAEYGFFLYNVQRGIHPPLSGRFNNIFYRESMGCPIRAEIWGMVSPGIPALAAEYARMDGELDHVDDSVWAEQFWAAAAAWAFFAENLEDALSAGRAVIPPNSDIYRISHEVPQLYSTCGDWRRVWKELVRKYGHRDGSKVQINFAFTLLSLCVGKGDLKETIVTAINCGWDADCTAATAGALLGVLNGADALPGDWKEKMGDHLCCDVNVRHKTSLLSELAVDTCKAGVEVVLTRNASVQITEVPDTIMCEVDERRAKRPAPCPIRITSHYPDEPVLYRDKPTPVVLRVEHFGPSVCGGKLSITPPGGVVVSPSEVVLRLSPGESQEIILSVGHYPGASTVWDKNLLEARWQSDDGESSLYIFGVAGSRQWQVYGPYWDAWDTTKWDLCPYRNDQITCHPVFVEGCPRLLVHEYIRIDREYLDEATLLKQEIPAELPITVERGEDHIDAEHLGGFTGEACYYMVRSIVARESVECNVHIGSKGPFVLWLEGEEMIRSEQSYPWAPVDDYSFRAEFDSTPRRIVIKCLRPGDEFRFSMCFIKPDVPGDKTVGISYLIDSLGDLLPETRAFLT